MVYSNIRIFMSERAIILAQQEIIHNLTIDVKTSVRNESLLIELYHDDGYVLMNIPVTVDEITIVATDTKKVFYENGIFIDPTIFIDITKRHKDHITENCIYRENKYYYIMHDCGVMLINESVCEKIIKAALEFKNINSIIK